jgi:hypothetical protein
MTAAEYTAELTTSDGEKIVQEFEKITDVINWSLATELRPAERIDIYFRSERIYTNARLPEP